MVLGRRCFLHPHLLVQPLGTPHHPYPNGGMSGLRRLLLITLAKPRLGLSEDRSFPQMSISNIPREKKHHFYIFQIIYFIYVCMFGMCVCVYKMI